MTANNEKPIGVGTGITLPGKAVTNFAAGTVEYVMLDLDRTVSRLPLINNSAINAAKGIPEISSLIMSGSFSRKSIKGDIDEYETIVSGIKEKKVDMGTYQAYQDKLLHIFHDVDYCLLSSNNDLKEDETSYRGSKRIEFLTQLPKGPFEGLNKSFYPDVHDDSVILERRFKAMIKEAGEKRSRSEEEYVTYIETRDKIVKPILDERPTKTEVPVVLYTSSTIDTEVGEILSSKMRKGTLRTKEEFDNTTWSYSMDSLERILPEAHKEEITRIQDEVKKGYYGIASTPETSTIVLQKLGLV
jgi:hypothetical protein